MSDPHIKMTPADYEIQRLENLNKQQAEAIEKLEKAVFDFDFTLFCAGSAGAFFAFTLIHLVIMQFTSAGATTLVGASFFAAVLHARKRLKA